MLREQKFTLNGISARQMNLAETDVMPKGLIYRGPFPRAIERSSRPEGSFGGPRMAVFNQSPEEKGGVLSLYPGFARFPHHFS